MANSHGRFVWYGLMTTDVAAAKVFYTKVVGWGTQDASTPGMPYTLFTAGTDSVCGLTELPEDARRIGMTPRWIGYVGVDDVDATADRIERLGGAVHVPPTDVPGISRFSVFVDPQMATLALFKWLHPSPPQPADLDRPRHVSWHELLAAHWETAFDFYSEVFGWQKADAHAGPIGTYQQFSAGGRTIGGMFTKPAMVPIPFWLFYVNVGDIDAALAGVKAGGGQILEDLVEVPGGNWIALCSDPQGAMFALEGKRSKKTVGYFERVTPSDSRGRRWSW